MRCQGNALSRRTLLATGVASGLGLLLPDFLRRRAVAAATGPSISPVAQNVIHIFLPGGMSQQESFDPKPYAPIEYRGDLGHVATVTGDCFSSLLPRVAQIADRVTVIRSMTHADAAHERGTHQMFTGYAPSPALVYPSLGSVVSCRLGSRRNLPPYVCVPFLPTEFAGNGYLSATHAPFSLGSDPARDDYRVRDLQAPEGVDAQRMARRRAARDTINARLNENPADPLVAMDSFYHKAYDLLGSPEAQAAFDIQAEPATIRDRYGRNEAGQRLLLARRLVAAGVRLVTVTYGGWDFHNDIISGTRQLMPALDQALAELILDLDASGLLAETIVMLTTEFGRTPKINPTRGRDHWPRVFSVLVAGGGFQRGMIYGASNATASEPERDPVSPADLAATMYRQLGIQPDEELIAPGNRPIEIVKDGRVLKQILATT